MQPSRLVFASTIFLSAFLLFQLQPIVAKLILPWFGGSAGVWTVCLLFFQVMLLVGYLYAHWLAGARSRWATKAHAVLLGLSLACLPVIPSASWKPSGGEEPVWRILGLLAATVGVPYLLLATTSPLLQAWYARTSGGAPYRFFALSNLASLVALMAYPVAIEPLVSAREQAWGWSFAYGLFTILAIRLSWRSAPAGQDTAVFTDEAAGSAVERPDWRSWLAWIALPACASALLAAVTNHLCQNVASIPFLWILPLAVYLASFILCFDSDRWYRRGVWLWLLAAALGAMSWALLKPGWNLRIAIPLFVAGLFACAMFCHGETARRRPAARYLTSFYLMLALGGALGSALVSLVAPRLFRGYYEFGVAMALCALIAMFVVYRRSIATDLAWTAIAIAMVVSARLQIRSFESGTRVMTRNFYGSLRVLDQRPSDSSSESRLMVHGVINHGTQFLAAARRREPTTYYGTQSGIGLAIESRRRPAQRVGTIGLGAGTMATYARPGDRYRFYEINPAVVELANREFTYLADCQGSWDVVLGDGRLSLEGEKPEGYDVLAVDAFSSDSIPVHLLSREAFDLYWRRLKPDGVLALHISNSSLELGPVVQKLAEASGLAARRVEAPGDPARGTFDSVWMLVSRDARLFALPLLATARLSPSRPELRLWTDDYSNLLQVLK